MEYIKSNNSRTSARKAQKAELAAVKRKLHVDEPSFAEEAPAASKKARKSEKQLLKTIVKMLSPGKTDSGSLDPITEAETLPQIGSADPIDTAPSGAVQVTTVAQIVSVQHPIDLRKIESLVQSYDQQKSNGAKMKPIASFLSEPARQGVQLRVNARLTTPNPPALLQIALMDMAPQELLQLARLLYPANILAVNSGSSQLIAEVKKLQLTHSQFASWETAAINASSIARTHSLDAAEQKRIVAQALKVIKEAHPKGSHNETEANRILAKITTAQQSDTFDVFFAAILSNLMANGVLYREGLEAGIFQHGSKNHNGQLTSKGGPPNPPGAPQEPRQKSNGKCNACGLIAIYAICICHLAAC